MKGWIIAALAVLAAFVIVVLVTASRISGQDSAFETVEVRRGPLAVWHTYEGRIESRSVQNVVSGFDGAATITSLAPEGIVVEPGTMLVTLDASEVEKDILGIERDVALALSELQSLVDAKHPLQARALKMDLVDAEATYEEERQFLDDSRQLVEEGLLSEFQMKKQTVAVEQARLRSEGLQMELRLTTNVLHETERARAAARLDSARQELDIARRQLKNSTIRSPSHGRVVHLPVHVVGEFRTVRVGDSIHKNQPFMSIPDMSDPIVRGHVPESELSRISANRDALVVPLAFPDLTLPGIVEQVGAIARTRVGQPHWKKWFDIVIRLDAADPRLRSDMSVQCQILAHQTDDAILVPRRAVWWENRSPFCSVVKGPRATVRALELGAADELHFEVIAGIDPGDRVRIP